jgi:hypothetical protein
LGKNTRKLKGGETAGDFSVVVGQYLWKQVNGDSAESGFTFIV